MKQCMKDGDNAISTFRFISEELKVILKHTKSFVVQSCLSLYWSKLQSCFSYRTGN